MIQFVLKDHAQLKLFAQEIPIALMDLVLVVDAQMIRVETTINAL